MSSIESKRVQYRKYLERAGVIDALSKALIKLYEEQNKPEDAIRFVRKFMCESCPDDDQFDLMKGDLEEANRTIAKLEQDLERLKSQIKLTPEEIAELLDDNFKALIEDEENNSSLLRKYLTRELLDELTPLRTSAPIEASLYDCVKSGMENHNARSGVYAADAECYDVFEKLFEPIIRDLQRTSENDLENVQKENDFGNLDEIENLDPERKYILSTRIRISRNMEGYPFIPKLREKQFIEIEEKVKAATEALDGEHTGAYYTMGELDIETQNEMVNRKILFKRGREKLQAAGCFRFWPTGRGIFHNPAETFLVWVNDTDHVRLISMAKCGDLGDVYNRVVTGLLALEKNLQFLPRHTKYGNLTTSLSIVGTALRASVHIRLPLLSLDVDRLKLMSTDLHLTIHGTNGYNSPIEDGVMEITHKRTLGQSEFELVKSLQDGVVELIRAEEELEASGDNQEDN